MEIDFFSEGTASGLVDFREFSPSNNFSSKTRARNLVSIDGYTNFGGVVWQESVYRYAREVFLGKNLVRIVDIGSGSGTAGYLHLADLTENFYQVDEYDGREMCNDKSTFIECNLMSAEECERLSAHFDDDVPTLFIFADVIEHLPDPRIFLRTLRRLLKNCESNLAVVSTPDRDRNDGYQRNDPPSNTAHYREWSFVEFGLALKSSGFKLEKIGHVQQNSFDSALKTICAEISCTRDFYSCFLKSQELPSNSEKIILTTEISIAPNSGGIGSYIDRIVDETNLDRPIILYAGANSLDHKINSDLAQRTITVEEIGNTRSFSPRYLDHEEILSAFLQLLFIYDEVRYVEYQDYLGIGYRIAQAKKADLLGPKVKTIVLCHGSTFYVASANGHFFDNHDTGIYFKERMSIELSDYVVYPSEFLKTLYETRAMLANSNSKILHYPLKENCIVRHSENYTQIKNLIFIGRPSNAKGFHIFCDVIRDFQKNQNSELQKINRIYLFGLSQNDIPNDLKNDSRIIAKILNHAELQKFMNLNAGDSLLVVPYTGDNQPLTILEAIESGLSFIAANAGGIPEIYPKEYGQLFELNVESMKMSIIEALKATPYERYLLSSKLQTYTKNRLTVARVEWLNFCQQLNETKTVFKESDGKYTVLITNFNGKFDEIKETLLSIKNFTRKPEEIIVVDDGSSEISYQILASVIADFPLHVNVLRTDTNNGLSSARNFGLDNIKTEFFISMDNDNVLSNHFAEKALRMISKDKEIAAVTSWSTFFNDGDDWNSTDKINHPDYTPEGADIATGISRNCFGDATAMYRTSYIKECNGWKSNKSDKWEDWSLFLHLTLKSYQISVIPEVHLFYRVKKNSMLRTYREFGSWLNLYSNLQIHPKYLYSLVNSTQVQRTAEVDYTKEINAITASLSWRATEPLRIFNSFSKGRAKVFLKRLSFGK